MNGIQPMQIVLLVASVQAFFLVVLLLTKRERHVSDRVLATWLGVIGFHTLVYSFSGEIFSRLYWIMSVNSAVPFLQGPFLYFYVDALTAPRTRLPKMYVCHLLPAVGFVAYQLVVWSPGGVSAHGNHVQVHFFDLSMLANVVLLISVPAYAGVSLHLLRRFRRRTYETFSTLDRINLAWLRYLVGAMVMVWLIILVFFVVMKLMGRGLGVGHLLLAPVTLFVYVTGFFGLKQTTVFSSVLLLAERVSEPPATNSTTASVPDDTGRPALGKYEKSSLSVESAQRILARLRTYMVDEEAFLDDKLTLPQVAGDIDVSVNHVSQVINELCDQSFHDFVNRYRVEAVQRKLQDHRYDAYSLLAIGLECGFGSKSSFNRIFKGFTGRTPGQYKRELSRNQQIRPQEPE